MPISCKHILSACAAVLVAAAFVFMCLFAPPLAYAYDTQIAAESMLDSVVATNNLGGVPSSSSAMVMFRDPQGYLNIRLYNDPSPTVGTSDGKDYVAINGNFYAGYYDDNGYVNAGIGNFNFIVFSDRVRLGARAGNYYDLYFGGNSDGWELVGYSLPNTLSGARVALEAYQAVYDFANSTGEYRWSTFSPTGTTGSLADTVNDTYKSAVKDGLVTTTTTTTTTFTTTTTTTTAATLPPYPYETSPPFTLPDDWTADYSETTPTPSLPPVGTADVSGYDSQISDAESQLLPGIAFWFVLLGDFLLSVPGIIISAIVFCILLYLTITLLYHKGGD